MAVTVRRSDIELVERVEKIFTLTEYGADDRFVEWEAVLDGELSTGERVRMSRTAEHAGEALLLLAEAIKEQGWVLE